jgi:diketogulonate reductase-like aldo/keto reductase
MLTQKPFIVPIPGTTKLAHLQENLSATTYVFKPDELLKLTADLSQVKIVGERSTGISAQQTKKSKNQKGKVGIRSSLNSILY